MTWNGIKDYSPNPVENTSINGIFIGEGCPPGNVNNAQRQQMADLANSPAKDPLLIVSTDADNAIARGGDGNLYIPSGTALMQDPAKLISRDEGNLIKQGNDGNLFVDPETGETVPWDSVTGKPETFPPSKHAATHLPGGSDPITFTNIPAGLIMLWKGTAATIPTGWALCNGTNGTPDLRDRFALGAGGAAAPGSTGGAGSVAVSGSTQNPTSITSSPEHSHTFPAAFQVNTSKTGDETLCAHIGYAIPGPGFVGIGTDPAGGGNMNHTHAYSATMQTMPPFYALCYIMKL